MFYLFCHCHIHGGSRCGHQLEEWTSFIRPHMTFLTTGTAFQFQIRFWFNLSCFSSSSKTKFFSFLKMINNQLILLAYFKTQDFLLQGEKILKCSSILSILQKNPPWQGLSQGFWSDGIPQILEKIQRKSFGM